MYQGAKRTAFAAPFHCQLSSRQCRQQPSAFSSCSSPCSIGGGAGGRSRPRQRAQLAVSAAATEQQQRSAVSNDFEPYILDLQKRIIQVRRLPGSPPQPLAFQRNQTENIAALDGTCLLQEAEELDGSGARFQHDRWSRSPDNPNAGYGITSGEATQPACCCGDLANSTLRPTHDVGCIVIFVVIMCSHSKSSGLPAPAVLEGGSVLEKAAANISVVAGVLTPERARAMSSRGRDSVDPAGGQNYSGG
jgi:hypothetical protein